MKHSATPGEDPWRTERSKRRRVLPWVVLGLLSCCALSLAVYFGVALSPEDIGGPKEHLHVLLFGISVATLFAAVCTGIVEAVCLVKSARTQADSRLPSLLWAIALVVLPVLSCFGFVSASRALGSRYRDVHTRAYEACAMRAEPLVAAIRTYEADHEHPPPMLASLVPEYLDSVPGTGMQHRPTFEYEPFRTDAWDPVLLSWGLGEPEDIWTARNRNYSWLEPEDESILVLFLVANEAVTVATDRMVDGLDCATFDESLWHSAPARRMDMAEDLLSGESLLGLSRKQAIARLGPADDEGHLFKERGTVAWELRVDCGLGPANWDRFFYWPTEDYPDRAYGGWVERIGAWAFAHE